MLSRDELSAAIDKINWWHPIKFDDGLYSLGKDVYESLVPRIELIFKHPVAGKTLLDVGAWDGLYSVEAMRRGAKVTASDKYIWDRGRKHGFDLVRQTIGQSIRELTIDPMDIHEGSVGKFDVVLFMGVLYHLKHPFYVIERLATACKEMMVMETYLDAMKEFNPAMMFYPGSELNNDASNWWGPNPAACKAMLKVAGFKRVEFVQYKPQRGLFHAFKD